MYKEQKGYGKFGCVSSDYDKARKGYPKEAFDFCAKFYSSGKILDVGCGTGISTRQLKQYFPVANIIGSDISVGMLTQAKKYNDDIEYIEAPTEELPFAKDTFDMVTAFGAFHWFNNQEALNEIKRVLKPAGAFCVINKDNGIAKIIKKIISETLAIKEMPNIKKDYSPKDILNNHLGGVEEFETETEEFFNMDELLSLYRSMSFSNLVPEEKKNIVEENIYNYFNQLKNSDGLIGGKFKIFGAGGFNNK